MGKVIAFVGPAGSGKTTAATYIVARGPKLTPRVEMRRHNFAQPIKNMITELAKICGVDQARARDLTRHEELKEQPVTELGGFTPRFLMQSLGTEWGRDLIHPDFWITIQMHKVNTALKKNYGVVYDDIRFENEANFVRALGGGVVGLAGRSADIKSSHRSETETPDPDFWIDNSKDEAHLHKQLDEVIEKYLQE